jgi:hypothetical protein
LDEARTLQGFKEIRAGLFDPKAGEQRNPVVAGT